MYSYHYLLEGSTELRTVTCESKKLKGTDFCNLIIEKMFGKNKPPCQLQVKPEYVREGETVTVGRIYGKKFHEEKKKEVVVPPPKPPIKRVRRWRSRSPKRRRWRSKSPVYNRYKRVYTNHRR